MVLPLLPFVQFPSHPLTASVVGDIINIKHGCFTFYNMGRKWHDGMHKQRAKGVDVGHVVEGAWIISLPVQLLTLYDRGHVAGKRHACHQNFQNLIFEPHVHRHGRDGSAATS